eukprot:Skav210496  [mRNA]  locus=scaffold601:206948:212341:+ [translate_table: standard]
MDVGEGAAHGCSWQAGRCLEKALAWWRETTDVVVINSPWLSRGTGRLFRCLAILYHCFEWIYAFYGQSAADIHKALLSSPFFYTNALFLIASLWFSVWSRRESFMRTTLFGAGMMVNFYVDRMILGGSNWLPAEIAALPDFALMCHCNVHPTVLFLGIFYQAGILWDAVHGLHGHPDAYSVYPLVVHAFVFESVIMVAFTWDFTQRVKAVGSGILFGASDELMESPVAGRSARIFCWFSGVNQWILWSITMVENQSKLDALQWRQEDGLYFRNHLPFSSIVAPFLSVGLVLLARCRRCRKDESSLSRRCLYMTSLEWHEDLAFAVFCCAPGILLIANTLLSQQHKEKFEISWYEYIDEMYVRTVVLMIAGVQTLIQGGCHPLICMTISAILVIGAATPFGFGMELGWFVLIRHWFGLAVTALLALSHLIDFFTRLPAIERGMQQSRQNAASSQRFLPSETSTGLELQFLRQTTDACFEQLVAPKRRGPAAVVAVVRHAERADNMQAFDAWGCSKDAADFPHDPPITAAGVAQAEQLAHVLEAEEVNFDVIVSSPFLRCLQTALILAKKFGTTVLVDQELGEVMGPPVFETEPPLPPRPWSNLQKTSLFLLDFFTRLPAIERGMQQSRQNAASSQRFLPSETSTGLELQFLRQTTDACFEQLVAPKRRGPAAVVAVVRHAERADNMQAFDAWGCSKDAADFPHDPPITAAGVAQAEQLAHVLEAEEVNFDVIVSSPFLRCLQTALILAKKFGTTVLVDQELGEVMGPPVFETEPPLPPRPWSNLQKVLAESEASSDLHSALKAGRFMGKQAKWAETLEQARLRYVKRYLDYLRRSRHTRRNFLLVTHGHMVQACATILPANQHRKVVSVDYCGTVVAEFHKLVKEIQDDRCHDDESAFFPPDSVHPLNSDEQEATPCEPGACQGEPPESPEKNQILKDAKIRYWNLWLRGVRTVPAASEPNLPNVGEKFDDLVKLLGTLPPVVPAPGESCSASSCSFSTRASTAVSMKMLREPDSVPRSPRQSEEQGRQQRDANTPIAPPVPQPKLTLSKSPLAARRGLKKPNVPDTVAEDQV